MTRRDLLGAAFAGAGSAALSGAAQANGWPRLIAHWTLDGDCRDSAGSHHGDGRNVKFTAGRDGRPEGAASFNGMDAVIEVKHHDDLRLGVQPFSVSAWVNVEQDLHTVIGDVLTKYDADRRRGFNLGIAGNSPAYSSVGDAKHVHFGIDNGINGSWLDCGKPWKSNPLISALTVYKNQLYASIADASRPEDACRVFRYAGGTDWVDCGRLGTDPLTLSVMSLIVHKGRLYAGTGVWDWDKAIKGISGPTHVYCYEGDKQWRDCGRFGHGFRVFSMASFKGSLYTGDDTGKCYRYDGDQSWTFCGQVGNEHRLNTLMIYRGHLYGASHGSFFRYEGGQEWTRIGANPYATTQVHTLQVYDSHLYAGTWPLGKVLRYEGGTQWTDCGQVGISTEKYQINEINDLRVYNGKLYAGVIPKAEVYRYEKGQDWTLLRRFVTNRDWSPADGYSWARIPCMAVYQGKLFHGTSDCHGKYDPDDPPEAGRVYAMEAGKNVSYDDDLGSGWKHLAAVRARGCLKLYVDGKLCATSASYDDSDYDLTNSQPLLIGLGAQSHFSGALDDIRIYSGELSMDQVSNLHRGAGV
jgi:hypothetical protein